MESPFMLLTEMAAGELVISGCRDKPKCVRVYKGGFQSFFQGSTQQHAVILSSASPQEEVRWLVPCFELFIHLILDVASPFVLES